MNPTNSNLFRLAVKDRVHGNCDVCNRHRLLVVRDVSTGWMICAPDVEFVLTAERLLVKVFCGGVKK